MNSKYPPESKIAIKIYIIAIALACLQPLMWYIIFVIISMFSPVKYMDGLILSCIVCPIGFIVGILWAANYIINGRSTWND